MVEPLEAVLAVTLAAMAFWHWLYFWAYPPETVSGDGYYIRRMAFTNKPQSAPYCWRPLFPLLARIAGFHAITYAGCFASVVGVYYYAGTGWAAAAMAVGFLGNVHTIRFSMRAPDYCDGFGQAVLIGTLLAMRADSPWAFLGVAAAGLTRENLGVTLALLGLFTNPWITVVGFASCAVAYFARREDKVNRHPLIEANAYDTLVRWVRAKREGIIGYAHVAQPLRGLPFVVPFTWGIPGTFEHVALLGVGLFWFFALPASGQSRMLCYALVLFAPFGAAAGVAWAWTLCLLSWFWPVDFQTFDEGGGVTWGTFK